MVEKADDVRRARGAPVSAEAREGGVPATGQSGIHCRKLHEVQTKMRKAEWSMRRGSAVRSSTGAAHRSQAAGSPVWLRAGVCGASSVQRSMLIAKNPHPAHADNGDGHPRFRSTITLRLVCQRSWPGL